jgi:hypothetical protein
MKILEYGLLIVGLTRAFFAAEIMDPPGGGRHAPVIHNYPVPLSPDRIHEYKPSPELIEKAANWKTDSFDASRNLQGVYLQTDSADNVFMAGTLRESGTGDDFVICKYDSAGNQIWKSVYQSPANNFYTDDNVKGIFLDPPGIYVWGSSIQSGSEGLTIVRFDMEGKLSWVCKYPAHAGTSFCSVSAAQGPNAVYVTGSYSAPASNKPTATIATIKVNSLGKVEWMKEITGKGEGEGEHLPRGIVFTAQGGVAIVGSVYNGEGGFWKGMGTHSDIVTASFAPATGQINWRNEFNGGAQCEDSAIAITADPFSNVFTVGIAAGVESTSVVVNKFSSSGRKGWTSRFFSGKANRLLPTALVADQLGELYLAANRKSSGYDIFLAKLDASGKQKWEFAYNGEAGGNDYVSDLQVDSKQNIYLLASSANASGISVCKVLKLNREGKLEWLFVAPRSRSYAWMQEARDVSNILEDFPTAIVLDRAGAILMAGFSDGDLTTTKLDPNGKELWTRRIDGPLKKTDAFLRNKFPGRF